MHTNNRMAIWWWGDEVRNSFRFCYSRETKHTKQSRAYLGSVIDYMTDYFIYFHISWIVSTFCEWAAAFPDTISTSLTT